MNKVFLSLGLNIKPAENIPRCVRLLRKTFHLTKISSVYETEPMGPAGTDKFWNLAVEIETDLSPAALKRKLRDIETRLGRIRNPDDKYAARTIDLDPLPQPNDEMQPFVIIPLAEIAPDETASGAGQTYRQLAKKILRQDLLKIRKLESV